ncbi:MAG: response regulator [Gammaproteobacteria bacterium]|nr:response regulator [Gammaproteobacteria bacterium]
MDLIKPLGFYFPTQVLCVDDELGFLDSLERNLGAKFRIVTEQNPLAALQKLNAKNPCSDAGLVERISEEDLDQDFDCPINVQLSKIIDKAFMPARHEEISVVVVDYSMPKMTGLALCAELHDCRIKKIMLTGEKDQSLAIEAFNKGVIDYFIRKDDPDLERHLGAVIRLLQQKYFQERTAFIVTAARASAHSFFSSPDFLKEFNRFLHHHQIVEFYLLDVTGSFLGLNAAGEPYWFFVKTEAQMMDLVDIAQSGEPSFEVVRALEERSAMVYFLSEEERNLDLEEWPSLAHPVTHKIGEVYLAWVEGPVRGFKS